MKPARLDCQLTPTPPRFQKGWLVFAVLTLLTGETLVWRQQLLDEQRSLQHHQKQLERRQALSLRLQQAPTGALEDPETVKAVNGIAVELTRPWEAMLDSLSSANVPGVVLDKIRPDAATGDVMIEGHADTPEHVMLFLQTLRNSGRWDRVQPVSEEQTDNADGSGLRFSLKARWSAS